MKKELKYEQLYTMAKKLARRDTEFTLARGPGHGDRHTAEFMKALQRNAQKKFGDDYAQVEVCGRDIASKFDFFFEDEGSIVEVALTLKNCPSEYERELFKAVLTKTTAKRNVKRIVFLSKPGASAACRQPLRKAIADWVYKRHKIEVIVHEL